MFTYHKTIIVNIHLKDTKTPRPLMFIIYFATPLYKMAIFLYLSNITL